MIPLIVTFIVALLVLQVVGAVLAALGDIAVMGDGAGAGCVVAVILVAVVIVMAVA